MNPKANVHTYQILMSILVIQNGFVDLSLSTKSAIYICVYVYYYYYQPSHGHSHVGGLGIAMRGAFLLEGSNKDQFNKL